MSLLLSSLSFLQGRYYRDAITAETRTEIACQLEKKGCKISSPCENNKRGKGTYDQKRFSLERQCSLPLGERWQDLHEVLCYWRERACDKIMTIVDFCENDRLERESLDDSTFLKDFFSDASCEDRRKILCALERQIEKAKKHNEYLYQTLIAGKREGFLVSVTLREKLLLQRVFFDRLCETKSKFEEILLLEKKASLLFEALCSRECASQECEEEAKGSMSNALQRDFEEKRRSFLVFSVSALESLMSIVVSYTVLEKEEESAKTKEEIRKIEALFYQSLELFLVR